jgi:predicted nuclease of predicted toxin-antitoxin system
LSDIFASEQPKLLFDNNLSPDIAQGLHFILRSRGVTVSHVREIPGLGEGATDESILAYCEATGACLVTRDFAIRRRPAFLAAIRGHSLGAFFLGGKEMSGEDIALQVLKASRQMVEHATRTRRPFVFIVGRGGGKLVKLPVD